MQLLNNNIYKIIESYSQELNSITQFPRQEVEEILMVLLNMRKRSEIYMQNLILGNYLRERLEYIIRERKKHIPLSYLTQEVNFYGFRFYIKDGVFIPRPETELIVDYIVKRLGQRKRLNILEVGTGAGVISICLTKFLKDCRIIATDINPQAIYLARRNAEENNCRHNIYFVQGNLLAPFKSVEFFDVIVSNPPYVGEEELKYLPEEVKREPREALKGGKEGFEFSLKLIYEGSNLLKPEGEIVIEIEERHKYFYEQVLRTEYDLEFIKDFQNKFRLMKVRFKNG